MVLQILCLGLFPGLLFFLFWPLLLEPHFLLPSSFSVLLSTFFLFRLLGSSSSYPFTSSLSPWTPFWTSFTSFYSLVSMTWTTSSTHLLCHLFYVHFWLQHFLDRHQQFSWTWTVWYDVQQKQSVNLGNRCSCSDSYIALSCIFSLFSVRETSS